MPLIYRAWKVNVNVWKRHLTLQSVFNCGECMMHVDKNADMLPKGSRGSMDLKFGHASQRFDGFEIWTCFPEVWWFEFRRASQRSIEIEFGCASQRSNGLKFGRASQRFDGFEIWMCYLGVRWIEILMCFVEVRWIELWTYFPEVRWIWNLDVLSRCLMVWSLDMLPRGPMELEFGHAS